MILAQIVPRLPPPEEGVGGIALSLAAALEGLGIESRFVVPAPHGAAAAAAGLDGVEIAPEPAALAAALEGAGRAILHYAGYGYHPRGVPRWLADGLALSKTPLWTQFHEVWATGPPWRSSFWLGTLQRRIVRAIGDRSERISTSLDLYADLIRSAVSDPSRPIEVKPVVSGIGEPSEAPPYGPRERRLVVFGGPGVRGGAYGNLAERIEHAARSLDLAEIWDVGPGEVAPRTLGALPVRRLGPLPAPEVSALLAESAAGFLAYPLGFLGKSSVFAAYAAHGVLPVCCGRPAEAADVPAGPRAGEQYWNIGGYAGRNAGDAPAPSDPAGLAAAARSWYSAHSLASQAAELAAWVRGTRR